MTAVPIAHLAHSMPMFRRHAALRLSAGIALVTATAGCVSDGPREADDTVPVADTTPLSVTIPPVRLTPFCATMIDLTDTVRGDQDVSDQDVDTKALIIDTYRSIESEVPPEIADDFTAVLTELETGVTAPTPAPVTQPDAPEPELGPTVPTGTAVGSSGDAATGNPSDGSTEFYFGGSTPAQRVNDYVSFACRDSENNPGPQATQPSDDEPADG